MPSCPTKRTARMLLSLSCPSVHASDPTNRFVFYNYTWNANPAEDYSDYSGKPIPSRVPLTALIRGKHSIPFLCHRREGGCKDGKETAQRLPAKRGDVNHPEVGSGFAILLCAWLDAYEVQSRWAQRGGGGAPGFAHHSCR